MKKHKVLKIMLAMLIIAFLAHQIYAALYSSVTTSTALYYEHSDGIDVSALIIRDENVISSEQQGVVHYVLDDSEKVAAGGVVASLYDNEESSLALSRVQELEKQLADVKEIIGYNDTSAVDVDICNQRVDAALYSLKNASASGNFSDISNNLTELLMAINRRQIATGESTGFDSVVASLNSHIASETAKIGKPKGNIKSEQSGYFVSSVDGYEGILTPEILQNLTPEKLRSIEPAKSSTNNVIGKVVSDYTVNIVAVMTFDEASKLKEGKSYTLKTQIKSCKELSGKVVEITEPDNNREVVVVIECTDINSELATIRTAGMKIVTKQYKGLKVSSKALRVVDGKSGVFTVSGMQVKFVETEILYTGDNFIICELQNGDADKLRLYDEVIEKGSDLYDGKIID